MSWPTNSPLPLCDVCGQFVSLATVEAGKAKLEYRQRWFQTMAEPDFEEEYDCLCPKHNAKEEEVYGMEAVIKAAANVLVASALDLIQQDPHQWSTRPCPTCRAVSAIVGRSFGCEFFIIKKKEG